MFKNRKVSRPLPVRPAYPKNIRVASKRSKAMDRLTLWFLVAMFGCCGVTAPIYVRLCLTNELRFEAVVGMCFVAGLMGAVGFRKTLLAWEEIEETYIGGKK